MAALEIVTFGCRLNAYESEVIRAHATAAGLEDTVIVHSCAVTAEAERQARQAIRRARRQHPGARIVVTGCSAQLAAERYGAMAEVDAVVGNAEKLRPETWAALARGEAPRVRVADIMTVRATAGHLAAGFDGRSRAFLEVQNGCDHRCTFCVIPFGRGPSRSVPVPAVVAGAQALVEAGYREIVLTGVDLASWGRDLPGRPALGTLCRRLLAEVPGLPRLRLSSLDPAALDAELLCLIGEEPRLMPHLHLSVQAGDDLILKRMRRRHLRRDVVALAQRLRCLRPEIVLGADLIAGFPTETEAMHARSEALVDEAGLTFLHVFPYSPRPRTPAARMPQVAMTVRRERAARLRALGELALERYLASQLGRRQRVLVERGGIGRTEGFAGFRFTGEAPPAGALVEPVPTATSDGMLVGAAG